MSLPIDLGVVKCLEDRKFYTLYRVFIELPLLEGELQQIIKSIDSYYESKPNQETILWDDFATYFLHYSYPDMPQSKAELYKHIFTRLRDTEFQSTENLIEVFREKAIRQQMIQALNENRPLHEVLELNTEAKIQTLDYIDNDIEQILDNTSTEVGLKWRLDCLNDSIGYLNRGMFVVAAAYVDVGKTAFAVSEGVYMAKQLTEGCVLWLNNEEDNLRVLKKIWKSTLGASELVLKEKRAEAKKRFIEVMHGDVNRIKLVDIRNRNFSQIKELFKKYEPKLAIIDQIDKISQQNKKSFSDHDRLKSLYGEVRSLANEFCPIIGISQADSSSCYIDKDNEMVYKLYLHHRQLDGSKVGKPGEADAIIMIGRRNGLNTTRGIHVSKTKFGEPIQQEVNFNGDLCRYTNP